MNATVPSTTCSNLAFSSLEEVEKRSRGLLEKKKVARFLDKAKDSQEVVNLVEQLRTAIVFYQVSRNRMVWARANARRAALTATVNVQSDRETGCKVSRR